MPASQTSAKSSSAAPVARRREPRYTPHVMTSSPQREGTRLLQWIQQQAGVSRRKAAELITRGEVAVNGRPAADPFLILSPDNARRLTLRGQPLPLERPEPRIYRFHKPAGMLCSHDDPFTGNTVGRLLRAEGFIGYTWVGRLDQDAEGLLLLSNDGDLIQAFTHPRYEVEKTYHARFRPVPRADELQRMLGAMQNGIEDSGEVLRIRRGHIAGRPPYAVLTLTEGRKHEIKRLLGHFHLSVDRLVRVSVGSVELGDLRAGAIERMPEAAASTLFEAAQAAIRRGGGRNDGLL
jgi:23S rRNA pseudouridine2605 synthase